jgi:hypothetical protein
VAAGDKPSPYGIADADYQTERYSDGWDQRVWGFTWSSSST